jgi:hypothetical protein
VTGSGNESGTYNSDYWVITQRDGEKYYFGLNHLPGWASGDTATNSVDSELRPLPDDVTDLDHFRVRRRDRAGGVIHEYRLVA